MRGQVVGHERLPGWRRAVERDPVWWNLAVWDDGLRRCWKIEQEVLLIEVEPGRRHVWPFAVNRVGTAVVEPARAVSHRDGAQARKVVGEPCAHRSAVATFGEMSV